MAKKVENLSLSIQKEKFSVPYISKNSIEETANKLYYNILEGKMSSVSIVEFFKFTEDVHKKVKELTDDKGENPFSDLVRTEIANNSDDGKTFTTSNVIKLSLIEAGVKYDYSKCNDPILVDLEKQMAKLKKDVDARQKFLQSVQGMMLITVADPETGEMLENIEVYPPIKTSTSTFKTEILKD